ncbi:MAG: oligosaccharide flippase family protein [Candidatus Omnitrophica bacterium]|nr:oligosaccharide flippase family protein [Candidatus Omnitrophota bacterium]
MLNKVFGPFSIYTVSGLITQAIPVLLLPVMTRFLSPDEFGKWNIFSAILGVAIILGGLGNNAVVRGYFDRHKEGYDYPRFIFNGILVNFGVTAAVFVFIVLAGRFFAVAFRDMFGSIYLVPLLAINAAVYTIPLKLMVYKREALKYSFLNISERALEFSLSVYFVAILGFDWRGRLLGLVCTNLLFLFIGLYFVIKNGIKVKVDTVHIREILGFGVPMVFHSLGFVVIPLIDRVFLKWFSGYREVGLYSVASAVTAIIGFTVSAFSLSYGPVFFEQMNRMDPRKKAGLVRLTYAIYIIIAAGAVGFLAVSEKMMALLGGEDYTGSSNYIPWLVIGQIFYGMYLFMVNYIVFAKKTFSMARISLITVLCALFFDYVLVRANGPIGIAQAGAIVYFLRFLLTWYYGNKAFPMPWFSCTRAA